MIGEEECTTIKVWIRVLLTFMQDLPSTKAYSFCAEEWNRLTRNNNSIVSITKNYRMPVLWRNNSDVMLFSNIRKFWAQKANFQSTAGWCLSECWTVFEILLGRIVNYRWSFFCSSCSFRREKYLQFYSRNISLLPFKAYLLSTKLQRKKRDLVLKEI